MVANLMTKLKELTARDRTESAKIIKFKKRIETEDDKDILAEVKGLLQKVSDINTVNKADVLVFKGRLRKAVDDLCQRHNRFMMEADE